MEGQKAKNDTTYSIDSRFIIHTHQIQVKIIVMERIQVLGKEQLDQIDDNSNVSEIH